MIRSEDLVGRRFRFKRNDGSVIAEQIMFLSGTISGYSHPNEDNWVIEQGQLQFKNADGRMTTEFHTVNKDDNRLTLVGSFFFDEAVVAQDLHVLEEVIDEQRSIIKDLSLTLYGNDIPDNYADATYIDDGYPHTFLPEGLIETVLDVVPARFWLEFGSFIGGSAIRVANVIKRMSLPTQIICIDPFTGDVNCWDIEQQTRGNAEYVFMRLHRGRPSIFDRFLANVHHAGHADIILPISATSTVGAKLIERLFGQRRISLLPEVIYLDSAHEPDETFTELKLSWRILKPGGVLIGDDWGWRAVQEDVTKFARTVEINDQTRQKLLSGYRRGGIYENILLADGQWILCKP
jgi:predicted O-methyltransferase YrrM